MLKSWKLPEHKTIRYQLNSSNNWYQVFIKPLGFSKMPNQLRVQPTIEPRIKEKADNVIEGHTISKRKEFFTGLRPTNYENLYFGDDGYNNPKKKSFILFHFTPDQTGLHCYFFNDYTPPKQLREQFIESFWEDSELPNT